MRELDKKNKNEQKKVEIKLIILFSYLKNTIYIHLSLHYIQVKKITIIIPIYENTV